MPCADNGSVDIQRLFQQMPGLFLVLEPEPPYRILAASDDYLRATHADRAILGRTMFEAFPCNPQAPGTTQARDLHASFERVKSTRAPDRLPTQRYDARRPGGAADEFEERWWAPLNAPILGDDGEVEYIVHRVEDATDKVRGV